MLRTTPRLHPEPPVTKLRYSRADEDCMDGPIIEPTTALWAVAEVFWRGSDGAIKSAPATLEDTSPSGACVRLKTPIAVGPRLTVKWLREHFSAVARNCRSDGREFLLGVRRELAARQVEPGAPPNENRSESRLEPEEPAPQSDLAPKRAPLSSVGSMVIQSSPASQSAPNLTPNPRVLTEPAPAHTALVALDATSKHSQGAPVPRTSRDRIAAPQDSPLLTKERLCHRKVSFPTSGAPA